MQGKLKDEAGNRYGRWTVIKRAKNSRAKTARWLCLCDCGCKGVVVGAALRRGESRSCGCLAREVTSKLMLIDLTGQRFGRWVVIRRDEDSKGEEAGWLCKCDCGGQGTVKGSFLRKGESQSCGCRKLEMHRLPKGESSLNTIIRNMKKGAKKRGLEWNLTKEQVRDFTKQPCHYCGIEPQQVKQVKGLYGSYTYNGIDRVDNKLGYFPENVVPCCKFCNSAKRERTVDEFREWAQRLYEHYVTRPL